MAVSFIMGSSSSGDERGPPLEDDVDGASGQVTSAITADAGDRLHMHLGAGV
jgi:hypothetical protein